MLEWIKVLGPVLISWPVVGLIALALFHKPLLKIINQFTNSRIRRAKVGPIEIEQELVMLADKVEEQKIEQERQQSEIETLKLLLTHFVSEFELDHLRKLAGDEPFMFQKGPSETFFEAELRHLLALGFIGKLPDKDISTLFYEQGEVKNHFCITEAGRKYLKLRESLQRA